MKRCDEIKQKIMELLEGKEYKYGMVFRPLQGGAQPQNHIRTETNKDFRHGVIVYDRELTQAELDRFELIPLNPDHIDHVIQTFTKEMKPLIKNVKEMGDKDTAIEFFTDQWNSFSRKTFAHRVPPSDHKRVEKVISSWV